MKKHIIRYRERDSRDIYSICVRAEDKEAAIKKAMKEFDFIYTIHSVVTL